METMMTDKQADAVVESMFHWLYDEPLTNPERQRMQLSMIANIVITASMPATTNDLIGIKSADITCQPLHDAYQRAKKARGLPR